MKIKLNKISENVMRNSQECLATVVRVSGDYRATVVFTKLFTKYVIYKIRLEFMQLTAGCPFNETAV